MVHNDLFLLRNAGYPDDPAMHGLIAGLWSSLSGLGRFVSRVGSGILVDIIGFNYTAAIATVLQLIVVSIRLNLGWVCLGSGPVGSGLGVPSPVRLAKNEPKLGLNQICWSGRSG